jgi:hypothetical protein
MAFLLAPAVARRAAVFLPAPIHISKIIKLSNYDVPIDPCA